MSKNKKPKIIIVDDINNDINIDTSTMDDSNPIDIISNNISPKPQNGNDLILLNKYMLWSHEIRSKKWDIGSYKKITPCQKSDKGLFLHGGNIKLLVF